MVFLVLMKNNMIWAVYDVNHAEVVGIWNDICDAEEFLEENESSSDVWAVMPADELCCDLATL